MKEKTAWIVVTARDARLLAAQRYIESIAKSERSQELSWSYVHPAGVLRSSDNPLSFLGLFDRERQLKLTMVGDATVANRYPRESWISSRKDNLLEMRGLQTYDEYVDTFGIVQREEGPQINLFEELKKREDVDDNVEDYVCLVGDIDDVIDGVNGATLAAQMRLVRRLMECFTAAGMTIAFVLDDDKACCPLVSLMGQGGIEHCLPRHLAGHGLFALMNIDVPLEALDGAIRNKYNAGEAIRFLGVQGIEDGEGRGLRVSILIGGDCHCVLVRGIPFGYNDTGKLEVYSDVDLLIQRFHLCIIETVRTTSPSAKMRRIVATAPNDNPNNVWTDVWHHLSCCCVVADDGAGDDEDDDEQAGEGEDGAAADVAQGGRRRGECLVEDVTCCVAPLEAFGPLSGGADEGAAHLSTLAHGVVNEAVIAARGAATKQIVSLRDHTYERLVSGPGGGCVGFGSLAIVMYLLIGSLLFACQLLPTLLAMGAIVTDGSLYIQRGDRTSMLRGGGLLASAALLASAYVYGDCVLLCSAAAIILASVFVGSRHPYAVIHEHRQCLAARIEAIKDALPSSVTRYLASRESEMAAEDAINNLKMRRVMAAVALCRGTIAGFPGAAMATIKTSAGKAVACVRPKPAVVNAQTSSSSTRVTLVGRARRIVGGFGNGIWGVTAGVTSGVYRGSEYVVRRVGVTGRRVTGGIYGIARGGGALVYNVVRRPFGRASSTAIVTVQKSTIDKSDRHKLKQMMERNAKRRITSA